MLYDQPIIFEPSNFITQWIMLTTMYLILDITMRARLPGVNPTTVVGIWIFVVTVVFGTAGVAGLEVPTLNVPSCDISYYGNISFNTAVPDSSPFPLTYVTACYDDTLLHLDFTATGQSSYYFDPSLTTNDETYNFTVMEAFVSRYTEDPATYLEFEVAPNNVTYNAFVYNPSLVRADGAVFEHFFIDNPLTVGITAETSIITPKTTPAYKLGARMGLKMRDAELQVWYSKVRIPLALFNVADGQGQGTSWRMNFFRTTYDEETAVQTYGAWSVPDKVNFHITPYFGNVNFI